MLKDPLSQDVRLYILAGTLDSVIKDRYIDVQLQARAESAAKKKSIQSENEICKLSQIWAENPIILLL